MKVIHVPFCFAPDPVGGTEVFVAHVSRDLNRLGVDVVVAAPSDSNRSYEIDGLRVRRFATLSRVKDVAELYGSGDPLAAAEFGKLLDEEKADVVHLHAFTAAVSLKLVRAAKSRKLPVVFTYHTPTVTCQRGTLRLWGSTVCDGELRVSRCTACTLHGLGVGRTVASAMAMLPPMTGDWLGQLGMQGGVWTALRYSNLIQTRQNMFRQMASEVDHIVAVCNWVRDILLINGVDPAKTSISRQGVEWEKAEMITSSPSTARPESKSLSLAFVGRLDPTKGLDTVIDAFRMLPTLKLKLDVYGVVQNCANAKYREEMLTRSADDPRIAFKQPLASNKVVEHLVRYDFVIIPSRWLETGPMVALEAFAAGVPVVGTKLGGIPEIVRDGIDGVLVDPGPPEHWARVLSRLATDASLRANLKAGVRTPRRAIDVAREMLVLYNSLRQARSDGCVP